jgi:hypothetical protein
MVVRYGGGEISVPGGLGYDAHPYTEGRLPGDYYLEENQHELTLRRPDGTGIGYLSKERPIPEIVEEVVEMVVEDVIVNAGKDSSP